MSSQLIVTEEGDVSVVVSPEPVVQVVPEISGDSVVLVVHDTGPQGPMGPPGPTGTAYAHHQVTPAATWTITHNLNSYRDPVIVIDSNPDEIIKTDVEIVDTNTLTIIFPSPESGWAYL